MGDLVRCVGAVVYDNRGRLLLVQRGHDPERGRWSVPGGRVNTGEPDDVAVRREVREETNLSVTVRGECGTLLRPPYLIVDYFCVLDGGRPRAGDDAAALRFVPLAEFEAMAAAGQLTTGLADTLRDWGALPSY